MGWEKAAQLFVTERERKKRMKKGTNIPIALLTFTLLSPWRK